MTPVRFGLASAFVPGWMKGSQRRSARGGQRGSRGRRPGVLAQRLEDRVLLAVDPAGYVDVLNRNVIAGWAYDADTATTAIQVEISINGETQRITANNNRPDLTPVIGSANHGFSFAMPTLAPGNHAVKVSAVEPGSGKLKLLAEGTVTNPAPSGVVDVFNGSTIMGWGWDADAGANPIHVRVDVNGSTFQTVAANGSRPDLTPVVGSPNHGFTLNGDFSNKVVEVLMLDAPSGSPVLMRSNNQLPQGYVDTVQQGKVTGWVWDPNRPNAAVTVKVLVDGTEVATGTANQNRPDLVPVIGSANHGYSVTIPLVGPGSHKIEVIAVEADSQVNTTRSLGSKQLGNPEPGGIVDFASNAVVNGWAYDVNAGANPIQVQVWVDGTLNTTVTANGSRPDLTPVVGSPNHGFTANLNGLADGPHKLEVYGVDNPSGEKHLIATRIIDNNLPFGFLDVANQNTLMGWAHDPDPNGTAQVRIEIDGVTYDIIDANKERPDLASAIGSTNHGFSLTMPTLSFGTHTIKVFAIDTFTGEEVQLGTPVGTNPQVTNNPPSGWFDAATSTSVSGWAFDPDRAAESIEVLLAIDGTVVARGPANLNRPDVAPVTGGSANHGFRITFQGLALGQHTYQVFAVDPVFGLTSLIGTKVVTVV